MRKWKSEGRVKNEEWEKLSPEPFSSTFSSPPILNLDLN